MTATEDTQKARTGAIVALVGAGLALLAFVAMPLISAGPLSLTAIDVAGAGSSRAFGSGAEVLAILWLVLPATLGALALAGWELAAPSDGSGRGFGVAGLAGLAALVYLIVFAVALSESEGEAAGFFGAGFWIAVIGAVAAIVGGVRMARASD